MKLSLLSLLLGTVFFFAVGMSNVDAAVVSNWISWTAPGSYPSTASYINPVNGNTVNYPYATAASGSLDVPNIGTVAVTLAGEILNPTWSPVGSAFSTANNSFWSTWNENGTTYISANVPALPPNSDRVGVNGFGNATQTLTFNQTVTNLVMNIWSLGRPGTAGSWTFNAPFVVLSENTAGFQVSGNTISAEEGAGTIQFTGAFSSLAWTIDSPEALADWNIGATSVSAVPEPSVYALLCSGLAFGGLWYLRHRRQGRW